MRRSDFPATDFLCDVMRHKMGKLAKDELRRRWASGAYPGVNADWAREVMKHG